MMPRGTSVAKERAERGRFIAALPAAGRVPWERLTVQARKEELYAFDFVADEAWADMIVRLGTSLWNFLDRFSYVMLKPEAIARRCACDVFNYLEVHRFRPVALRQVELGRSTAHQMWRYQWNAATIDRVRLTTFVNERCPSLMIVVRDESDSDVPASVRLWGLKGSAHAEKRTADHLRTAVRMHNRMLGFVHTPDEPADLVRELGVLLRDGDRDLLLREVLLEIDVESPAQLKGRALDFESRHTAHEVDPAAVVNRLVLGSCSPPVTAVIDAIRNGKKLPLAKVHTAFGELADEPTRWDFITVAAEVIRHDRPGVPPMIAAKAAVEVAELWKRGSPNPEGLFS